MNIGNQLTLFCSVFTLLGSLNLSHAGTWDCRCKAFPSDNESVEVYNQVAYSFSHVLPFSPSNNDRDRCMDTCRNNVKSITVAQIRSKLTDAVFCNNYYGEVSVSFKGWAGGTANGAEKLKIFADSSGCPKNPFKANDRVTITGNEYDAKGLVGTVRSCESGSSRCSVEYFGNDCNLYTKSFKSFGLSQFRDRLPIEANDRVQVVSNRYSAQNVIGTATNCNNKCCAVKYLGNDQKQYSMNFPVSELTRFTGNSAIKDNDRVKVTSNQYDAQGIIGTANKCNGQICYVNYLGCDMKNYNLSFPINVLQLFNSELPIKDDDRVKITSNRYDAGQTVGTANHCNGKCCYVNYVGKDKKGYNMLFLVSELIRY